jgi:hypothetical protein
LNYDKKIIKRGEKIAKNPNFNGEIEYIDTQFVDGEFRFHLFYDSKTKTTFSGTDLENTQKKLAETRKVFGQL